MYNAVIDIGNTLIKIAIFKGDEFILMQVCDAWDEKQFSLITKGYFIKNIIVSDVRYTEPLPYREFLEATHHCLFADADTKIPISNAYASKQSLGFDRLAIAIGARNYYPTDNLLIISVGTCFTYNFLNEKNEFIGGGISPGLQMRFTSLHQQTSKLPLIYTEDALDNVSLVGTDTESSIISGVLLGAAAEIDGIIDRYKENYDKLTVVLTGGDWSFLAYSLKNKIFAHPNLVLFGLNSILQNDVKK